MLVRAQVLLARTPEQEGAGYQLVGASARRAAEAAAAHVGDGEAAMLLEEGPVVWASAAAVIDDTQRAALEDGALGHNGRCYARVRGAHNRGNPFG